MESWLTDMAREGLYLERQGIDWGLGHFYPGEPRALPNRLVSSLEHPTLWQRLRQSRRAPNQEARELAAQAGWEYVSLHQSFYVYRATTKASPGDGNRPPASGRGHSSGIVVVCRFPVSDLAVAVCALSLAMVFLRPIHLGHREGIVRIALPLSPWNRKRGGTVWENPALLSRRCPKSWPQGMR